MSSYIVFNDIAPSFVLIIDSCIAKTLMLPYAKAVTLHIFFGIPHESLSR